jgi:hypothetical protein
MELIYISIHMKDWIRWNEQNEQREGKNIFGQIIFFLKLFGVGSELWWARNLSLSLLSLSLSLSLTQSHTHTLSLSFSKSVFLSLLSFSHYVFLTFISHYIFLTFISPSVSHSLFLFLAISFTLSLSLTHTNTALQSSTQAHPIIFSFRLPAVSHR